jgi:YqaJ-like viral recombinase domain
VPISCTMSKFNILERFIAQCADAIRQHTDEWFCARKRTIGGSEIAIIQGRQTYQTLEQLIAGKCGIYKQRTSIAMSSGNVHEHIIRVYTALLYNCAIVGHDLFLIWPQNKNVSYSPDGLGIVAPRVQQYDDEDVVLDDDAANIALFEFKCPYNRIPRRNYIPEYYISQVHYGLNIIDIADYAIYAEAVIRQCSWAQLDSANTEFRNNNISLSARRPMALGFIIFSAPSNIFAQSFDSAEHSEFAAELKRFYDDNNICISTLSPHSGDFEMTDFIGASVAQVEGLFGLTVAHHITAQYSPIVITDLYRNVADPDVNVAAHYAGQYSFERNLMNGTLRDHLESHVNSVIDTMPRDNIVLGIYCWKMLNISHHQISRVPNYISQWEDQINDTIALITKKQNELAQ